MDSIRMTKVLVLILMALLLLVRLAMAAFGLTVMMAKFSLALIAMALVQPLKK